MFYTSTRDKSLRVTSSEAITKGISDEGGLFVPCEIPALGLSDIEAMIPMSYRERAKKILSLYLTDFTPEEIDYCVDGAYAEGKFDSEKVAPLVNLKGEANILELFRGPTCAFKDMALQLLPYLLTTASKRAAPDKETVILVATSGDTGKAALEGFKDVPHTRILVFYPVEGVSAMQKRQMQTQEGANVGVCAIKGNFDDAQTGVKKIFTDKAVSAKLAENGMMFSSANSINWGRLVPQVVYYCSAYCDMVEQGRIALGDQINVVVPTGNFGNILAAYYAKQMGIPIKTLICASNSNNVLTDFLTTGTYDRNRKFYTTTSPSMDILISSNLERLLFHLSVNDDAEIREYMDSLSRTGKYTVSDDIFEAIRADFKAGFATEEEDAAAIKASFDLGYLPDTHTAVAIEVYNKLADGTPTVIAATASPYKFPKAVLAAILGEAPQIDEFDMSDELSKVTGTKIPAPLAGLRDRQVRFDSVSEISEMEQRVYDMLGI
ncbi:MAG: threonine synthase [Clostridia bacterium]|nr:threonine synthase [Clostridia bacterium]MBQ1895457.1 threonine synthase [Clostridia bacterium]MBQ2092366.1 threonine synthase [Clostridia bacterium]